MFDRRRVLQTLAGLFLAMAGTGAYAAAWEPGRQLLTRYRLKPRGWPELLSLTITALSAISSSVRVVSTALMGIVKVATPPLAVSD